jgi:hypothetical protein
MAMNQCLLSQQPFTRWVARRYGTVPCFSSVFSVPLWFN